MARKQVIQQRDFSAGELREDFLEGDDLEIRGKAVKGGSNCRAVSSRTLKARPGSFFLRGAGEAREMYEIRPTESEFFGLVMYDGALRVIDQAGAIDHVEASVPWGILQPSPCVLPLRETTYIIGDDVPLNALVYEAGAWAFGEVEFDAGPGDTILQPYWKFDAGSRIQPSAATGTVTITGYDTDFSANMVGTRIRYGGREIEITGHTNATTMTGDVVTTLPPSFEIDVASTTQIRSGDIVIAADSGWQGLVESIVDGTTFRALTTENFDGPSGTEDLSFPAVTMAMVTVTPISPVRSRIWDEQLMSAKRGYPRSMAAFSGRLFLCDFPEVPNLIAASSNRSMTDFLVGEADDDAIVRTCGDDAPRFRHMIAAGDLVLLSDRGSYYIPLASESDALTPTSFRAIQFDRRGCNGVRPVKVDDAIVFVEISGQTVSVAFLEGNIYRKWGVRALTTFCRHLISGPVALCGPALASPEAEKYLFVVNGDGTMAAVAWGAGGFGSGDIGFFPWETSGEYLFVAPIFDEYWAIVDRDIPAERVLERFDYDALVDCAVSANPNNAAAADHLIGSTVHVAWNGRFAGTGVVDEDGILALEDVTSAAQIGFNFTCEVALWPAEVTDSPRAGIYRTRVFTFMASVQHTGPFQMRANAYTVEVGGYLVGEDLSEPPALQTSIFRRPVTGARDHPDLAVIKHLPGEFHVLATGQEVSY